VSEGGGSVSGPLAGAGRVGGVPPRESGSGTPGPLHRDAAVLSVVLWHDQPSWDAYARRAKDATVMHLYGWRAVIERAYGHPTWWLAAVEGHLLRGLLPLTLVRSRVFGRHLVSLPFMDYGGVCADGDVEAEELLVGRALDLAREHDALLSLRYSRQPALDLKCSLEKVTMWLDLGSSESALWTRLRPERRNRIRKGQKHGLSATFYGNGDAAGALPEFYRVFAANMRDLGSPVHSLSFFHQMVHHLGEHCRVMVVRDGSRAIGAAVMLLFNGMVSIPWVSSLRSDFEKCPNQVLYWEAMRFAIANGLRTLDLGRSSLDSGTFEAKRQWGAEPVQLYWAYAADGATPPGDQVKRLGWAENLWRRLPLPIANILGPRLRGGIPN
jgi:FemAB-related protein (PEP-CTERM system-associated)